MRCILFSGVALGALAISFIAPAHAQVPLPAVTRATTQSNCSGIEQCVTAPAQNGFPAIHKADGWREPAYGAERGPRLPFPPARIGRPELGIVHPY